MKENSKNGSVKGILPDFISLSKKVNTEGVLPAIIAEKAVFGKMKNKERVRFYQSVLNALPAEYMVTQDFIKLLCWKPELYLQTYVTESEYKRKPLQPEKWHLFCGVLEHFLLESIAQSFPAVLNAETKLKRRLKVVVTRRVELEKEYDKYCKPSNN